MTECVPTAGACEYLQADGRKLCCVSALLTAAMASAADSSKAETRRGTHLSSACHAVSDSASLQLLRRSYEKWTGTAICSFCRSCTAGTVPIACAKRVAVCGVAYRRGA
jgi:hypothetical protein